MEHAPSGTGEVGPFAHTLADFPPERWQPLADHLLQVASQAADFASAFDAREWGYLAGLWHDLGKYSDRFQEYLRRASMPDSHESESGGKVDHSTAGARHSIARFEAIGHILAFPIAGHHSGLLDAIGNGACLDSRLKKQDLPPWDAAPSDITDQPLPPLPSFVQEALARRDGFSAAFFVRMLFSSLVDADFLDTQAFMAPGEARQRTRWPDGIIEQMSSALDAYIASLSSDAIEVNRHRSAVLEACQKAADRAPGLFSLTVPTGGGKTLSSLSFALRHVKKHGLSRVIYVAPFTSIIEQNSDVFRRALRSLTEAGIPDPVIEHHSNIDPDSHTTADRLATENWDAPLVVTTSVQFYESLFANRTSRCRKLHNIARAVIILDEAQCIPVEFLAPCLKALDELCKNYGCSVVLCTATQPAIQTRTDFPIGLDLAPDREIIPDRTALYGALKRVTVEKAGSLSDEELVLRILSEERVLCIVNTRKHAARLAEMLGQQDGHMHLSALMCPEHRSQRIEQIRERLQSGGECRLISTNLIEAGVDLDFPVVFRALSGLDSIAQAAGRCNRNGLLPSGRTVVFEPESRSDAQFLADMASSARQVLLLHDDPLDLKAIEHYFRLHYWDRKSRWDSKTILRDFSCGTSKDFPFLFKFATVADRFRLIEDAHRPVIVPWGAKGKALCEEVRTSWNVPSPLRRRLQRFTVTIPFHTWEKHRQVFEMAHEHFQVPVLAMPEIHYSDWLGLNLEQDFSKVFTL